VLTKQVFVIDGERTVEAVLKDAAKDVGGPVSVTDFVTFRLGEGISRTDESES
jgi:translation elongation factor EF-Ts